MSRKRHYDEKFLTYGFSFVVNHGVQVPLCVLCHKTFANESMKPSKLRDHLTKVHPAQANKDEAFFKLKEDEYKRRRMDRGTGVANQVGVTKW